MDTKWRNLIIIIALVVVVALGYLYLTQMPLVTSDVNPIEEDKEYLVLANLFSLSDMNVLLFRSNELVVGDSNELELVYSKDRLIALSTDLNDMRDWSKTEIDSKKYAEFSSLIDIYQAEINTNILMSDFSKRFNSVVQSNSSSLMSSDEAVYCAFVGNNYPDFTIDFDNISNSMIDLSEKNYTHYLNYGVLIIDYDFNTSWTNLNYAWDSIYEDIMYCDEKGLIE